MPLLGQYPEVNVTTQLPRNFSKPFSSPSSPVTPHSAHEIRDWQQYPPFTWTLPYSTSPPLRRKPCQIDLTATGSAGSLSAHTVTRPPARLAPFRHRQQQLAPQLFPSTPLQQLPTPTSPSLSSTITTLQSTPTHSPIVTDDSNFERWHSATTDVQVSFKRKFPLTQAKRLPRRETSEWCVYAAVTEREIGDLGESGSTKESESETCQPVEVERIEERRGRSVRFAGIAKESSIGTEQSTSGEDKEITAGSTYTLSKFKFPEPPGHTWAGTFGHFAEPTPPTSPATLHYRGASFDVVNPHASLLLGKNDIETPAEIDGLLDDYFADRPEVSYNRITGQMSSQSLGTDHDGSKRGRILYADPESARRTIMRLPSAPFSEPHPTPIQESPLAGKGHTSTLPPVPQPEHNGLYPDTAEYAGTNVAQHVRQAAVTPRADDDTNTKPTPVVRGSSVYANSIRSDPFDLQVSDDEGYQFNNIDEAMSIMHRGPHNTTPWTEEQADLVCAAHIYVTTQGESGEPARHDEGADAEANVYPQDRDTTIGNIVEAYDYTDHPVTPEQQSEHAFEDGSLTPSMEHGRDGGLTYGLGNMSLGDRQSFAYAPMEFDHARHPPPGLPLSAPRGYIPQHYEYTDLPSSDQTYGATRDLLGVTPENKAVYEPSYPYPTGGTAICSPYSLNDNKELYHPHDNKENVAPNGYGQPYQNYSAIPTTWSNADLPLSYRGSLVQGSRGSNLGTKRLSKRLSKFTKPRTSSRYSGEDYDDDVWEDMYVDVPAINMSVPRRESEASYANTSDSGTLHVEHFVGAKCCTPSKPAQGQPSLQAVPLEDGTLGHVQFKSKAHRTLFSLPGGTPEDTPDSKDVNRAIVLIKAVLGQKQVKAAYGPEGSTAAEYRESKVFENELHKLRYDRPRAVQEAANLVAPDVRNMRQQPSQAWLNGYNPIQAFQDLMTRLELFFADMRNLPKLPTPSRVPHNYSRETRRLLGDESSDGSDGGLAYSHTFNSFRTVPDSPRVPDWLNESSLLEKPSPALTFNSRGVASPSDYQRAGRSVSTTPCDSQRTGRPEEYEMNDLVRCGVGGGTGRPAMSGQTSLRPLQLGNTNLESSTTSFVPGRRMTDADLMQREPNWTMSPSSRDMPRTAIDPPSNTLLQPMLINRIEAANLAVAMEQKRISNKYFVLTAFCPISALLFGLGFFDRRAKTLSEGRVDGMGREDKYWARWMAAPLGVIFYAIIAISAVVIVVVTRV